MMTVCLTCSHIRIVHKDGIGICSITDCRCTAFVPAPEDPLPDPVIKCVKYLGAFMEATDDPVYLTGLANLGNYLWFRLQQKNAKVIGEPVAERKHEDECKRYKALLPKEWQW